MTVQRTDGYVRCVSAYSMRAQMEENEQLSVLMAGLRGSNMNDEDFADQDVVMQLISVSDADGEVCRWHAKRTALLRADGATHADMRRHTPLHSSTLLGIAVWAAWRMAPGLGIEWLRIWGSNVAAGSATGL